MVFQKFQCKKWIKYVALVCFLFVVSFINAQTPGQCFEIESILVDACVSGGSCTGSGSPACNCEGKNEMVRFKIGSTAINTSDLDITWPNNPYLGISPANATTAGHVAALNATIQSCGLLVEPIGGVLPAGKTILLITSTDMCNTANSFGNLADTIYVIFQNAGNFAGHFVNYNSTPGLRTTIFKQLSTGCADTVTYDRSQLVNQSNGQGGSSSQNDGSTVEFSWPGAPTYINHGCQAPIEGLYSAAGNGGTICPGGTVNLAGTASGNYTSISWHGGLGLFSHSDSLNTLYTADISETDSIVVSMGVIGHCNDTVFSSTTLYIMIPPTPIITASSDTNICIGDSVMLTAFGGNVYTWNTGATTASIYAHTAGTYTVTSNSSCGAAQATKTINYTSIPPTPIILAGGDTSICPGDSVMLTATAGTSYLWNTGSTNASIHASSAGTYTVTATTNCGSGQTTKTINMLTLPSVMLNNNGVSTLCAGNSLTLFATGSGNYSWSTGAIADSITVSTSSTYSVTASTACGFVTDTATIIFVSPPNVAITPSGSTVICPGTNVSLMASGGTTYLWNTGLTANPIAVSNAGQYTVVSSNSCGTDSASVTITSQVAPNPAIFGGNTTICPGDSVVLTASGATNYLWSTNQTTSSIVASSTGLYSVVSSNSCGSGADTVVVAVDSILAQFTADSLAGTAPLTVHFTNTSVAAISYLWTFGDSTTSVDVSPTHVFQEPGTYEVTLEITSSNGCIDTTRIEIIVSEKTPELDVPNVFTPNGDGINDVFVVKGIGIKEFSCMIYDRWGIKITELKAIAEGWDGKTTSGNTVSDGTYFYLIKAKDINEKNYDKSGYIQLLRK
jgi:gliding motility-associated-like protein